MAGYQGSSTRRDPEEALAAFVESERRDINTMIPGKVVSYDRKRQKATIQPMLSQKIGEETVRAPELVEVPVSFPRAGGFVLHKPLKKDDEVILHFAQRSLDASGEDGSDADGAPGRMHDLSDAVALPASFSKPKEMANMPEKGIYFGRDDGKAGLTIDDNGKVDFKQEGDSLKAFLKDFLTAFRDHLQPAAHDKVAVASQLLTRLDNLMA